MTILILKRTRVTSISMGNTESLVIFGQCIVKSVQLKESVIPKESVNVLKLIAWIHQMMLDQKQAPQSTVQFKVLLGLHQKVSEWISFCQVFLSVDLVYTEPFVQSQTHMHFRCKLLLAICIDWVYFWARLVICPYELERPSESIGSD